MLMMLMMIWGCTCYGSHTGLCLWYVFLWWSYRVICIMAVTWSYRVTCIMVVTRDCVYGVFVMVVIWGYMYYGSYTGLRLWHVCYAGHFGP